MQADCLLETQAHVLERFVTGMMAEDSNRKKKGRKSVTDEKATNDQSHEDDDAGDMMLLSISVTLLFSAIFTVNH